jgi:hypothetical protein
LTKLIALWLNATPLWLSRHSETGLPKHVSDQRYAGEQETLSLESGMACLAECQEQSALYQKLAQCTKGYTNETEAPVE